MGVVKVDGIRAYAYHGCMEEESKIGQYFFTDVYCEYDFSVSYASDDLKDTLDYVAINKIVEEEMAIRSKLIEHVAYRIQQRIYNEHPMVQLCQVTVIKPCPPLDGDVKSVSVIV